ncbi:MAG TPA: hypothetical protein ENF17_09405 [Candidatus Aminicenantes bacterium]|nr:hypothetical protein [Candidatus Aminicenantes bacterium]
MDLKDKLNRLRKEREARSRTLTIRETWDKLQADDSLSTREKLEELIRLTQQQKPAPPAVQPPFQEKQSQEPFRIFENTYALNTRYGQIEIAAGLRVDGRVLSCLSQEQAFEELDLRSALFLDLETTGLSGGTGVVPFLVGLGFYLDDSFRIVQFFLGDLAEEERMIGELARFFREMDFQSVVTYNGKAFDLPLLETRFILYRNPFHLAALPHLDFLFPARSLWKHKLESCRLFHLAREIVLTDRAEDIPSAEIPWRYFQYLRSGNFGLVEPIIYHNEEDILSLLGVVIAGAAVIAEDESFCPVDAMDFFGAGKIFERTGDVEKSVDFFQRALNGRLTDEVSLEARRRLSLYFKRSGELDKAVPLWQEMASSLPVTNHVLFSLRELAMYFEHRLKDYEQAKQVAEEGFVLAREISSSYYLRDFDYRLARLQKKSAKSKKDNSAG